MTPSPDISNVGLPPRRRSCVTAKVFVLGSALLVQAASGHSATTNLFSTKMPGPSLPETGPSLLRVLGALALVLGLFLGGAWLVRNGRFSNFRRASRLNVLETRSLGARQAIYVVAYGPERFLIGSTPAGINLLSHLASSPEAETEPANAPSPQLSFGQALAQVLRGEKSSSGKTMGKA